MAGNGFNLDEEADGFGEFNMDEPMEEYKDNQAFEGDQEKEPDEFRDIFGGFQDGNEEEDIEGMDFFGGGDGKEENQGEYGYKGSVFESGYAPMGYERKEEGSEMKKRYLCKMREEFKTTLRGLIEQKEKQREKQDKVIQSYKEQMEKIKNIHTS